METNLKNPVIGKQLVRYLYEVLASCFFLAVLAAVVTNKFGGYVHRTMLAIYGNQPDIFNFASGRALVFLASAYMLIFPIYLLRLLRLLNNFVIKKNMKFKQKLWLTLCFFSMVPLSVFAPFLALTGGNAYAWRAKFAYDALTSFSGLIILGGGFLWASAIFVASAIHFLPLIWFPKNRRMSHE